MKKSIAMVLILMFMISSVTAETTNSTSSQLPLPSVIQKTIKKTLSNDYKIDRVPVESDIYLRQIITSYNAHMKHAVIDWLKKELVKGSADSKELYYLLSNVDSITTSKQAIIMLARAVSAYQTMRKGHPSYQENKAWQERAYNIILLQTSVILVSIARAQLLLILDTVHDSLMYWKEQQRSPVKYFFHKSPLKWVMGKRQAEEIASNIKKLEKLEYDVRVVLGRLTKHIYNFNIQGDVNASYTWIEELLSMLKCVGAKKEQIAEKPTRFENIADGLRLKLGCVSTLKSDIFSSSNISSAIKPGYFTRHWLSYSAALVAAYFARAYYMKNKEYVNEIVGPEALMSYIKQAQEYTQKYAITPLVDTMKAIFVGSTNISPDQEKAGEINRDALKKTLQELATPRSGWLWGTYGVVGGKPLSEEDLNHILTEEAKGNLDPLLELLNKIDVGVTDIAFKNSVQPLIRIILEYATLSIGQGKKITKEQLRIMEEQFRVVRNLLMVSPSLFFAGFGAVGLNKLYRSATVRDYSSLRLGLLDINSLFIEAHKPLIDHDYGKLIYLLQGLKSEAMRDLTEKNMLTDFLVDLAKLESNKFDVETKRSIIQNMFMKYPFLTLNAKSA